MSGSSGFNLQRDNNNNKLEDRISQLQDEFLLDILSLLPLKDVGRSSVLSKRWRDLWKLIGILNFDASDIKSKIDLTPDMVVRIRKLGVERSKFVTWVNQVLRLHECDSIEEFRVKFDLDSSCSHDIDEWVKFMIRKRAKRIELDLSGDRSFQLYGLSEDCYSYIKSGSNLENLMNIRSLCLDHVNVDGELLEYLLTNCRNLEILSVHLSKHLVNLKVSGPSLALKSLRIGRCTSLESIELCAPKLERLSYYGRKVNFLFGNNPHLTDLDVGSGYCREATYALVTFTSILSQLETLTLHLFWLEAHVLDIPEFCELSNLKHLTIELHIKGDRHLNVFSKLLVAAPLLSKFTLMFRIYTPRNIRRERTWPVEPLGCLKEVEILGFRGGFGDFEMAKYLIRNAPNLEKMVINTFHPEEAWRNCPMKLQERLAGIKKHVSFLKQLLSPGANLIVSGM